MQDGYDGIEDAQHILEVVMHRKNWSVDTRDELAEKLKLVRGRHKLRTYSAAPQDKQTSLINRKYRQRPSK